MSQLCPAYHNSGNQTDPLRQIWHPSFATDKGSQQAPKAQMEIDAPVKNGSSTLIPIIKAWESFRPLFLHGIPAQSSQKDRLNPKVNTIESPFLMSLQLEV